MSHSARKHLRVAIDSYDESIRRFIPGYETLLAEASAAAAAVSPAHVLDLGAGTGGLSEALLERDGLERGIGFRHVGPTRVERDETH